MVPRPPPVATRAWLIVQEKKAVTKAAAKLFSFSRPRQSPTPSRAARRSQRRCDQRHRDREIRPPLALVLIVERKQHTRALLSASVERNVFAAPTMRAVAVCAKPGAIEATASAGTDKARTIFVEPSPREELYP